MIKIDWLEKKDNDWKLASVTNEAGAKFKDVSINRVSKKGDVFPNFDNLMPGMEVDGILWQSSKGRFYLFPQKEKKGGNPAYKTKIMNEVIEKKQEGIKHAQENKELGIKISSVNNKAVECAIAEYNQNTTVELKYLIEKWRKYLWLSWDNYEKFELAFVSNQKELELTKNEYSKIEEQIEEVPVDAYVDMEEEYNKM